MIGRLQSSKIAYRLCCLLGVGAAFTIVVLWFPHTAAMWTYPIQQIDAPAHYYFIRKLLDEGLPAAARLWPNDEYYPPFFHVLVAGLVKLASLCSIKLSIIGAFNTVWIAISGIIWPFGCQLLASYWTKRQFANTNLFACIMAICIPVFAVSSPSHPYWMLNAGPLIAFGMATSILPLWLYVSLRLLDDLRSTQFIVANLVMMAVCLFAHPRIAFTWLLFIVPFIVVKLSLKYILGMLGVCAAGAVALFAYMTTHYQSSRYFNPSSWFHTFVPARTLPASIGVLVTDNIAGPAGILVAIAAIGAVSIVIIAPWYLRCATKSVNNAVKRESVAIGILVVAVSTVYVCSAAVTGWFANIVTAVWYRGETRPITMLPLLFIMLFSYALSVLWYGATIERTTWRQIVCGIAVFMIGSICLVGQVVNPLRTDLRNTLIDNTSLHNDNPHEQMTIQKYQVLADIAQRVDANDVVIADPLNGSMYGTAAFGTDMLYPIYNPKAEKNGAIFGQVERAFASGDPQQVEQTVCPISPRGEEYFLDMGQQAPSLQMFTFKEQYDPFHDEQIINSYVDKGVLQAVQDYTHLSPHGEQWKLYRFSCR